MWPYLRAFCQGQLCGGRILSWGGGGGGGGGVVVWGVGWCGGWVCVWGGGVVVGWGCVCVCAVTYVVCHSKVVAHSWCGVHFCDKWLVICENQVKAGVWFGTCDGCLVLDKTVARSCSHEPVLNNAWACIPDVRIEGVFIPLDCRAVKVACKQDIGCFLFTEDVAEWSVEFFNAFCCVTRGMIGSADQ